MEPARVAERIEAHLAKGLEMLSTESIRVAGGVLGFRGKGSHTNKAVGLGLAGVAVTLEDLEALEAFYVSRGVEPRIELTGFADEALLLMLGARGFALEHVESVVVKELEGDALAPASPPGITIERLDPANDAELRACALVQMSGFVEHVSERLVDFVLFAARLPVSDTIAARADGAFVGAGGCQTFDGVVGLFGASVASAHRRRGIQRALIAARVKRGLERGADLAFIVSKPGIATERNATREGFRLAYARVVLVKRGPGLTGWIP